jgi:hypothetical protein
MRRAADPVHTAVDLSTHFGQGPGKRRDHRGRRHSGCARGTYDGSGAGAADKTNVLVNGDGSRVIVLLLNSRHTNGSGDEDWPASGSAQGRRPPRVPHQMRPQLDVLAGLLYRG